MHRILAPIIGAAGLWLAASAMACAADMPTKAPPPAAAPVNDWNGFYFGGNFGYAWEDPTVTTTGVDSTAAFFASNFMPPVSFNKRGEIGGFQAGYNWTMSRWLLGLEADFNFSNVKGATSIAEFPTFCCSVAYSANEEVRWFGTFRGRAGLLASPNLLIFGTGGFAYGKVVQSATLSATSPGAGFSAGGPPPIPQVACSMAINPTCYTGSSSRIAAGWTAGGGFEYLIWQNWTAKVEYLFVDLGQNSFVSNAVVSLNNPSTVHVSYSPTTFQSVRGGLDFHF